MKKLIKGEEAVARGSIESGVSLVCGYPGSPITGIIDSCIEEYSRYGIAVEWSVNEKVAVEQALGASLTGLRSMVVMKHVGVNIASDPLMVACLSGTEAGVLIVAGDDPGGFKSQNEQDSRMYSRLMDIPTFEPSDPEEAREMTIRGFSLSEELRQPVLLRVTEEVMRRVGEVEVNGSIAEKRRRGYSASRDRSSSGINVVRHHRKLHEKVARAREISNSSCFNVIRFSAEKTWGVISSGNCYYLLDEVIDDLGLDLSTLKLGMPYPLPDGVISTFLRSVDSVLVIEEVEPFIEEGVRVIANFNRQDTLIRGKQTGDVPCEGAIPKKVISSLLKTTILGTPEKWERALASRNTMDPGCPLRASHYALRRAIDEGFNGEAVVIGDTGCNNKGSFPPLSTNQSSQNMGASISIGQGIARAQLGLPIVAVMGDSSLLHSGLQGLVNAVPSDPDLTVVIMDNETTAETGMQPNPASRTGLDGYEQTGIDLKEIVEAAAGRKIDVIDPFKVEDTISALKGAMGEKGLSVIILKRPCALLVPPEGSYLIGKECTNCGICIDTFGCPAIVRKDGCIRIIEDECRGCAVCVDLCPEGAIHVID